MVYGFDPKQSLVVIAFSGDVVQVRQGRDGVIGLQSGTNSGASQAGHGGMGNTRHM